MSGFLSEYGDFGDYIGDEAYYDPGAYMPVSDVLVQGSPNSPPVVSDTPETSVGSVFSSIQSILGSVGRTARDIGTTVGTVRRDISTATQQYRTAQTNAYSGNSLGQWWQYATTQDKLMVGLAVAGIAIVLIKR